MGLTHYAQLKVLNEMFGATALGEPATWYAALYTAAPTNSGGGTETTYTDYARVAITNNTTNFPAASGGDPGVKSNGTAVTFPAVGAAGATVVAVGLLDASSAGNLWMWTMLEVPRVLSPGDAAPSFAIGELTFQAWGV